MTGAGRAEPAEPRAEALLAFWFGLPGDPDYGRKRALWFERDEAFDAEIHGRFLADYEDAAAGRLDHWRQSADRCLALILLLDQVPRNLFRDDARAYASDAAARRIARFALEQEFDRALPWVRRLFLYLPFEHSEDVDDQRLAVALMRRIGDDEEARESRARAERYLAVIERFGRFPHRNAVLGRTSTPAEAAFLRQERPPLGRPER